MGSKRDNLPDKAKQAEVDAFLRKVAATPAVSGGGERGRLLFAMDATASREPTWDQACLLQAQMFEETANLGGLDVQLCHYRGFKEFTATLWVTSAKELMANMTEVRCAGGTTQIGRVLAHALAETRRKKVNAVVFVGDCMEEDVDHLCHTAGELGLLGLPLFMFQEGHDDVAQRAFKQIARLSGGAYCRFDADAAQQLRELLSAVAVYAAGGRRALEDLGRRKGGATKQLSFQIAKK